MPDSVISRFNRRPLIRLARSAAGFMVKVTLRLWGAAESPVAIRNGRRPARRARHRDVAG
jgi:hypothetical protein